ncbi:hypothetical protein THAOC_22819, partial [Thalassiosira oceanica]
LGYYSTYDVLFTAKIIARERRYGRNPSSPDFADARRTAPILGFRRLGTICSDLLYDIGSRRFDVACPLAQPGEHACIVEVDSLVVDIEAGKARLFPGAAGGSAGRPWRKADTDPVATVRIGARYHRLAGPKGASARRVCCTVGKRT